MRKLLIVALVAVTSLAVSAPVFATTVAPAKTFTAGGKVVSVDPGASTMVVHVTLGSRGVKRSSARISM